MASITFDKVTKKFGNNTVIEDLDLKIEDGSFTVLVGPRAFPPTWPAQRRRFCA